MYLSHTAFKLSWLHSFKVLINSQSRGEGTPQSHLLECRLGLYSFTPKSEGFSLFLGLLVHKTRLGTGRTPSPGENCLGAVPTCGFFWPPALLTTAGPSAFAIESITTSSHTLTLEDAPHPGGEAQPGRIGPIITLIIYFSPSTPKSARGRSIIPSAFQSCNIYSKPEPLPVNVLSEECHLL